MQVQYDSSQAEISNQETKSILEKTVQSYQ